MRLHRLDLQAFGPFPGCEQVDFDRLCDSGLFLLCGPTGAGKTSVLDAVCFALFGQVPGDRDKAKRLRSDHAPTGAGPRVVLEVTVRGRRLRITRSPEWLRPKKRGTGEVKEHAKVLVEERLDGQWQARTSRLDEAGDLVGSLLGLSMSQFCQVALLPQGRFETFLRCGAQERHALLERLFGAHRFRAVEEWLAEHRRGLAAESGRHAERLTGLLERVAEAAGAELPHDLAPDAALDWCGQVHTDSVGALAEATQTRAIAEQAAKDARGALDAARDLADRQARHRDAVRRDQEMRALHESTEDLSRRLQRARRAAEVQPLLELHEDAVERLAAAEETERAARRTPGELPETGVAGDAADSHDDLGPLAETVRRLHAEATRLEELLPLRDQIAGLDHELDLAAGRRRTLQERRMALDGEARRRAEDRAAIRDRQAEATAATGRVEGLRERLDAATRRAEAAAAVPSVRQQRAALVEAREQAADAAQQARQVWLDLRQARLDGMAGELARGLAAQRPCPVCGSREHPAAAEPADAGVSADAERTAEDSWHDAEQRRQEHTDALARCDRELAALQAAAGDADADTAAVRRDKTAAELEDARALAAQAGALGDRLAELDAAAAEADRRCRDTDEELAQLGERSTQLTGRRTDLQRRVDDAAGEGQTLTGRLEGTRRQAAQCERLHDARRDLANAREAHARATSRLAAAVDAAGFADADAARAAVLAPARLDATETLLRRRADEAARMRAVLDDPAVRAAADQPPADVAAAAAVLEEAERRRAGTVAREQTLEHRGRRLAALHEELGAALAAWAPVRDALAVAERMAALCAGTSTDNRHRMRLSAYVLAARLEQVVAAANERLLHVSSGRYCLQHSVSRGVGDRRGGLGLQVHDGWTGDLRDPATLSGGEMFYTSLALALGLADVVAHEVGGTEVSTLFVDEGFGSLDADTLDEVMDVLDQLRSGGRAVGIVSHLADLRARVPAQVHVRKTPAGSTLDGPSPVGPSPA